jgi:hypothetical protein
VAIGFAAVALAEPRGFEPLTEGVLIPTRSGTVKKTSTVKDDRGRIEAHIKPLLGHRAIAEL